MINRKVEFCNVRYINDSLFQGLVKGHKKLVESLGAEIKTGRYTAYGVLHEQTKEYKRIARRRRIAKQVAKQQLNKGNATKAGTTI